MQENNEIMNNESLKKCIRCKLPFIPEDWEDTMCRECVNEYRLQDYEEGLMEREDEDE